MSPASSRLVHRFRMLRADSGGWLCAGATMTQMLIDKDLRAEAQSTGIPAQPTPTVAFIQGRQDHFRAAFRSRIGPYDNTVKMCDLLTNRPDFRCIAHQRADPNAVDEPGRPQAERAATMWFAVLTSAPHIKHAARSTLANYDAKWRLCSCGIAMFGLMCGCPRTQPKPGEGPLPEMETGGYVHHDMHLACVVLANHDNFLGRALSSSRCGG